MAKGKSRNKNKQKKSIKKEIRKQLAANHSNVPKTQSAEGEKKRKKMIAIFSALGTVIGLLIAIVSFWLQTNPNFSVTSLTSTDPNDPMSTFFTISNNGVLALMDVRFVFTTDMVLGTNVFKDVRTSENEGQQNVEKINPGQKISQGTGIKINNFEGNAVVKIDAWYYPQYYPRLSIFERHSTFRFESIRTSTGYSWIEQPVD
jgi:hypothetical protein